MAKVNLTKTDNDDQWLLLKYQPFCSIINPGFWQHLTKIKLDKLKLSKEPVHACGSYSSNLSENLPCLASFDHNSFRPEVEGIIARNKATCSLNGTVICTNFIQEFLDLNKKHLLDSFGQEIWQAIVDGRALIEPDKHLSKFGLLVYADLKKYNFVYWFSFPSLNYPKEVYYSPVAGIESCDSTQPTSSKLITEVFPTKVLVKLQEQFDEARHFKRSHFVVKFHPKCNSYENSIETLSLIDFKTSLDSKITQGPNESISQIYFAYIDPSSNTTHPGWPLRNYLCLIATQFQFNHIKLIRIRLGAQVNNIDLHYSLVSEVRYDLCESYQIQLESAVKKLETPLVTGWEKNSSQQMAPRRVCLSNLLDSKKLAEDALNLNLRLMKWRLIPTLNLEKIAATKCLLLGCGTLGCHIARGLVAWGVKNLTLVDNAKLSYSNPVRQTLYTYEDCTSNEHANYKAQAAKASLQRIHPSLNVEAHVLTIPMPGHHILDSELEQTRKDVAKIQMLIESHDAIFLLMDTRESRWLPTVISMSEQKFVINAAIGFDTFLLQRFGVRNYANLTDEQILPNSRSFSTVTEATVIQSQDTSSAKAHPPPIPSNELGCYFCNDIVAPGDSTQDRTLDQQCTVSRPGVSMMVSALALELFASVISSKDGPLTPAPVVPVDEDFEANDLGLVPHCIRGNLSRFEMYMPTSQAFSNEFLERVFDDPGHLEEVAGLKDLQGVDENTVWAFGSDDEDDVMIA